MCRGKQRRFPDIHVARDIRVISSISEGAWKLVTKCLRNPRKRKFPACFLPFCLTFPYVSHSLSHFLCFPECFSLFPILGLTAVTYKSWKRIQFSLGTYSRKLHYLVEDCVLVSPAWDLSFENRDSRSGALCLIKLTILT